MSITLITGIPGGGKSYWAAYQILKGKVAEKYKVYHNIVGLDASMLGVDASIQDWTKLVSEQDPGDFFSRCEQTALCEAVRAKEGRSVLMIIDEAGAILNKENDEWFRWLSWHRHLGQDVWIIVQHSNMIARCYRNLAELEIRGVKSHVIDHFIYSHRVARSEFKVSRLPKDQAVFKFYKSFDQAGVKNRKSKMLLMAGVGAAAAVGAFAYLLLAHVPNMYAIAKPSLKEKGPSGLAQKEKPKKGDRDQKDEKMNLSFAGILGGRVLVQGPDGLGDLALIVGPYRLLSSDNRSATVVTLARQKITVHKKTIPAFGGGRGAAFSPPPKADKIGFQG